MILGTAAAVAGVAGVGNAVHGAIKMKKASSTMKTADQRHKKNLAHFETQNKKTNTDMDRLGTLELEILQSFEDFSR